MRLPSHSYYRRWPLKAAVRSLEAATRMRLTEEGTLRNFDSFSKATHRQMDHAALLFLLCVQEVHEES